MRALRAFSAALAAGGLVAGAFTAAAASSPSVPDGVVGTPGREGVVGPATKAYASRPARTLPVVRRDSTAGRSKLPPNRRPSEIREKTGGQAPAAVQEGAAQADPAPAPAFTFEGISSAPERAAGVPDPNGDVGSSHYVQMVNRLWAVYSKTGTLLGGPFAENSLWQSATIPDTDLCKTSDEGDPIVLYDELADRWLLSFFAFGEAGGEPVAPFYECIAVSKTSDPLGAWWLYSVDLSSVPAIGDSFPDYPKFGVWPNAYYMSANLFPTSGTDALFVAFEREQMLAGGAARFFTVVVSDLIGNHLPADVDGAAPPAGSPGYFVVPDPGFFRLRLYRFAVDWTIPSAGLSSVNIPVATYDHIVCSFQAPFNSQCVDQPGTSVKLDPIDHDQMMFRLAYRNFGTHESLIASQTIDVAGASGPQGGRAGIRWYEIRSPQAVQPVLHQQGTFAPDTTTHRWLPSIAADKFGNIAVGYNVSNATTVFPGIRYAGRRPTDPLGELSLTETTLIAGGGSKTAANSDGRARWGDYSSMSVDPVDDCTFWYTGEYLAENVNQFEWNTRIGVFRIPPCTEASANAPADFDGDRDTDFSVWRPSDGTWYAFGGLTEQWGISSDVPVPGQYDADAATDVAVWRPSDGLWFVKGGATQQWGISSDVPVPGDYDGDGDTEFAVWRPADGTWYVHGGLTQQWGISTDIPVPGQWDADPATDIAVWRPSTGTWYVHGGLTQQWGISSDIPVPGQYDADPETDVAVWRPSEGTWYVHGGLTQQWGISSDVPVQGDYDGDGDTEFAVWRPSSGTWYVFGGATQQWGISSDKPLPVPPAIARLLFP